MSAGHGGQILLTSTTAALVREALPARVALRDLGERRLKDLIIAGARLPDRRRRPADRLSPLRSPPSPGRITYPCRPRPLIDRQAEIADIRGLLERGTSRLVTLWGPGGTGKTRLAIEVAGLLQNSYADGVFLVDLAPVSEPELVGATIAATLGVRETGGRPLTSTLQDYLRARDLLLVLDNFEQVLGAALLVGDLLAAAPGLRVLVTSRAPLHLRGEQAYEVPPLGLTEPESGTAAPAVTLFVARAQQVRPDFALTAANRPAVAAICRRLDGLPLAIELAAARTRILPPAAVLARLERGPALLAGGSVDMPARHRALHDTIAWSYDLLAPAQQQLFQRLAVFAGGCTLPAVEAICAADGGDAGAVLDDLSVLVEQSLLRTGPADAAEARFWMLETIREFAVEEVRASGRAPALQGWHLAYFLGLCEAAAPMLRGPQAPDRLAALAQEQANWRAALAWAAEHAPETGLRLAVALGEYWRIRGPWSEGQSWLERLLAAAPAASGVLRARALLGAAEMAWHQSDLATAREAWEAALALFTAAGDAAGMSAAKSGLGAVAMTSNRDSRKLHEESLELAQQAGDLNGQVSALGHLGGLAWRTGDVPAARAHWEEALELAGASGDQRRTALMLLNLGVLAYEQKEYATARALTESARTIFEQLGDREGVANARINLGLVAQELGEDETVAAEYHAALVVARDQGSQGLVALTLYNLGDLARRQGDYTQATARYSEGLTIAQAAGRRDQVATALHRLAFVALARGDAPAALVWARAALEILTQVDWKLVLAQTLAILGGVAAALGEDIRAARILGAVSHLGATAATLEPLDRATFERHCATVRARLDPGDVGRGLGGRRRAEPGGDDRPGARGRSGIRLGADRGADPSPGAPRSARRRSRRAPCLCYTGGQSRGPGPGRSRKAARARFGRSRRCAMDERGTYGQWLRTERRGRGLSQRALAAQLDCSRAYIGRLERGRARSTPALTARLATLFTVPVGVPGPAPPPAGPGATPPPARPTGTVTFLFTDVEGSTQLWERHGAWMEQAHLRHERILRETITAHGGWAYKQIGDAFQAAFPTAPAALAAAVTAQRALAAEPWGDPGPLRVRMALHTGQTEERPDDYVGKLLNRVARLLSAGHGGQILLTGTTTALVRDHLPSGVSLRDLGERRLKDLILPERVFQVNIVGLPTDFPPLRTPERRPHNLPLPPTPLIGRQTEVANLRGLLERGAPRLVTLWGPGGTGKTRLAIEVAGLLQDSYADGVFLVDLAPIADPELVGATIAANLGLRETGDRPLTAALQDYLRERELLLVLDNFEQVRDAAPLVAKLLAAAPATARMLVTSRAVLNLQGEQQVPVKPLALPAPTRPAQRSRKSPSVIALRRPRPGGAGRFCPHARECGRCGGDLPPARRLAAGDRARRGAQPHPAARRPADAPRAAAAIAYPRSHGPACPPADHARRPGPAADPARHHCLELRPPDPGPAGALRTPGRLRRRLRPTCRRGALRGGAGRSGGRAGRPGGSGRSEPPAGGA